MHGAEGQVYIMMTLMDRLHINTQVITQKRKKEKADIRTKPYKRLLPSLYLLQETHTDQEGVD